MTLVVPSTTGRALGTRAHSVSSRGVIRTKAWGGVDTGAVAAAHITPLFGVDTTQNQQQALQAGLDAAWAHIINNPGCANFLTGNSGGGSIAVWGQLANTLSNTTYSFASFTGADINAAATTNAIGGNQVAINTSASGAFFTSPDGNGTATVFGYNSQGQPTAFRFSNVATLDASILLHELGHETGVLPADGNNNGANGTNQSNILNNCFTKNAQGVYQ